MRGPCAAGPSILWVGGANDEPRTPAIPACSKAQAAQTGDAIQPAQARSFWTDSDAALHP